jgi:hypothetical protein
MTSSVGPESSKSPAGGDVEMGEMRIGIPLESKKMELSSGCCS